MRPAWSTTDPPPYPKSIGATKLTRSRVARRYQGSNEGSGVEEGLHGGNYSVVTAAADALTRELAAALRALDERHNAALWAHVREAFDYPVFVAAPKSVGISSTGETGETVLNDLPECCGIRGFQSWAAAGAKPRGAYRIFTCPPLPDPSVEGF